MLTEHYFRHKYATVLALVIINSKNIPELRGYHNASTLIEGILVRVSSNFFILICSSKIIALNRSASVKYSKTQISIKFSVCIFFVFLLTVEYICSFGYV
jgi:hypothetical protein